MDHSFTAAGIAPALCTMIAELLDAGSVQPHDDLFALGADSLAMTALAGRIADRWGVELAFSELMSHPGAAQVARLIEGRLGAGVGGSAMNDDWIDRLLDPRAG